MCRAKGPEGNICGDTFANVSINDNRNELAIRRLLQWTTGDAGSGSAYLQDVLDWALRS
jgi:hypothetical protein